jgi:long-chain acyl-CoA synthetase
MVKTYNDPNILANYTTREQDLAKHLVNYLDVETLPEIWSWVAKRYPDVVAVNDPHAKSEVVLTYTQLNEKIQCLATALQALGVAPGDRSTTFKIMYTKRQCYTGRQPRNKLGE